MDIPRDSGPGSLDFTMRDAALLCVLAALLASAAMLAGHLAGADPTDRWLLATRYTARVSFPVFVAAYVAPAVVAAGGVAGPMFARLRHPLALAFATTHTIHLGCIFFYFTLLGHGPGAAAIAVGGTAYLLLFAMLVTGWSWLETGGERWRRLHAFGPHYLWFVFFVSYLRRLAETGRFWVPFVALCVAALAVRVGWRRFAARAAAVEAG